MARSIEQKLEALKARLTGLAELHPSYEPIVMPTFSALKLDFPMATLKTVELYRGEQEDHSLADASTPGVIKLNAYWFVDRDVEELRQEARIEFVLQNIDPNLPALRWHGGMTEPQHVLNHEFGHQLQDQIAGASEWAQDAWHEACFDQRFAVSGYALSGPDEFWAEMFAAYRMGTLGDLPEWSDVMVSFSNVLGMSRFGVGA